MNNTLVLLKTYWWSASVSCKQFSSRPQGSCGTLRPFSLSEQHCAQMTTMLTAAICQPSQCWRRQWSIRVMGQTENNNQAFIHLLKQNRWEIKDLKGANSGVFHFSPEWHCMRIRWHSVQTGVTLPFLTTPSCGCRVPFHFYGCRLLGSVRERGAGAEVLSQSGKKHFTQGTPN